MSSSKSSRKAGFTLLELLVSVAIFSGIIILALGAFARSATSATRSNTLRSKVEAARSAVNTISADLRYVDTETQVKSLNGRCDRDKDFIGVRIGSEQGCDEIELLLRYPDTKGGSELVWKRYQAVVDQGSPHLYVYEQRDCSIDEKSKIVCPLKSDGGNDLIPSAYVLDGLSSLQRVFSGVDVLSASQKLPPITPFVKLNLTLKPTDLKGNSCTSLPTGTCYTLDTTIIPGGLL